ncbi:hypothetical protein HRR83_003179 [Exophiala dermatitidis]|uniref:Zn(2)-C6 fungal-type domain-containing protein n=2 Tax=Exophiala dermatitidis TaxID=5970 RepID=H6BNS1_EXODN|nr:uncharacterized protein HMPREF1120_00470 [Exophiala dermatitidis NIH/UT8656]KAJ4514900.1 hypothetical protein HRR75_004264 [Exophiala dermatitidis]EHY52256.1 hypothetical protein HMPREF1120_00470 [Exophiala dermatitidis NIH/UT8656]KAJ4518370.1 hypothetical protein HRR74_004665 [Exophiala dermatitidis]KAJ4521268.1 hypothetical protein HRR73_003609 [Exophiala dermatitidis]KAJ4547860.1 hypothetical protein HRR76_000483 [Exophiala dermatitidis]
MASVLPRRRGGIRAACDRCYELKERCERASTTSACVRCNRLSQICRTVRPLRTPGRRARHREPSASASQTISSRSSTEASSQSQDENGAWLQDVPDLVLEERELMMFLLYRRQTLQFNVVSPSFEDAARRSFEAPLLAALPVLKDAYLAYAGGLKASFHADNDTPTVADEDANLSLHHASSALETLRTLPVGSSEDAALCLTLGMVLALYIYSAVGVGAPDICHYCLGVASPYIEDSTISFETEPQLIFMVLLETMDCAVHRHKPTLRLRVQSPAASERVGVDRHLGLCVPLLPYYYDLCVISHFLIDGKNASLVAILHRHLRRIQAAVNTWQPCPPEGFVHEFSSVEVVHLLAQARVYRLAALLMAHRLQHHFGHENADAQADIWSREIMMELEMARRVTQQPIRFVTLPFIVAAIEIRDPVARIKADENVDEYVDRFMPVVQEATRTFLSRIWRERDVGAISSWFDSVHKPCVTLDALGDV